VSYVQAAPRSKNQRARIYRLMPLVGDLSLGQIDQQKAIELKATMLRADAAPGTYTRAIVMPLRAILHHAHKLGWCDPPHIIAPPENQGRTLFMLPDESHDVRRARRFGRGRPRSWRPFLAQVLGQQFARLFVCAAPVP